MDRPPSADLLAVAREAAQAAADVLVPRFGSERASGTKSSPTDVVSQADVEAEDAIRTVLATRRPGDRVLGEEGGEDAGTDGLRWVVDPLDGTVNFLYGLPQWCVSVAVQDGEETLAGVVLDPLRGEAFCATHDGPATRNGEALAPRRPHELGRALVATGFGYDAEVRRAQGRVVARVLGEVRDVRRAGSAALDLAWAAAGRVDAYFERGVQLWDYAAGLLVAERAGLRAWRLEPDPPAAAGLLVAPDGVGEALLALVGA